jgi:hypothetical protein
MRFVIAVFLALALAACRTVSPSPAVAPAATIGGDGTSMATAVVIDAANEADGVAAEYAWLREHFPGAHGVNQSLLTPAGGRIYDALEFTARDGTKHTVYFDISRFFGKM